MPFIDLISQLERHTQAQPEQPALCDFGAQPLLYGELSTALAVWRGAYLSTLQRIHLLRHKMCGDLAAHGLALDTSRADAVAARLEARRP